MNDEAEPAQALDDANAPGDGMLAPVTPTAPGVWPTLRFTDAESALEWLVEVLGFTEHAVYRGDDERPIAHAELLWPEGGGIMIGSDAGEKSWSGAVGGPGSSSQYLSSAHTAAIFDRVVAAEWQVMRPLTEQDYGSLEFACLDPEGNAWSIGTYRGENL
ncbi:VOC family protein [Subtercola sp. YIM 133946]|uniref:VOC family protein n=1 Tax=Subtercola sp. YIM 133946 TaxID=3118909 RepID=UPI002F9200BD